MWHFKTIPSAVSKCKLCTATSRSGRSKCSILSTSAAIASITRPFFMTKFIILVLYIFLAHNRQIWYIGVVVNYFRWPPAFRQVSTRCVLWVKARRQCRKRCFWHVTEKLQRYHRELSSVWFSQGPSHVVTNMSFELSFMCQRQNLSKFGIYWTGEVMRLDLYGFKISYGQISNPILQTCNQISVKPLELQAVRSCKCLFCKRKTSKISHVKVWKSRLETFRPLHFRKKISTVSEFWCRTKNT